MPKVIGRQNGDLRGSVTPVGAGKRIKFTLVYIVLSDTLDDTLADIVATPRCHKWVPPCKAPTVSVTRPGRRRESCIPPPASPP